MFLPAHLRPDLGFLTVHRRTLAVAALGVSAGLLGLGMLPATAATTETGRFDAASQSLQVAPAVAASPAERADFEVTEFTPVRWPLDRGTDISSHFGYRVPPCAVCSSAHQGVDWTPGAGTAVDAIAAGAVVEVGNPSGALGVYAIVRHDIDGKRYSSVYGHLQLGSLTVKKGDTVKIGDRLGRVGNTGTSTGAHLHFGILDADKVAIDPIRWLKKHVTE